MNILKHELKSNAKGFLLWASMLVALLVAGMMEYEGIVGTAGDSLMQFMELYPPIVFAMFGMSPEVDVTTLSGYNWVLSYYVVLCGCIYAIMLGTSVINRELGDKTYEFLFTKPRGRGYVLTMKILGALVPLTMFGVLNYLCSTWSIDALGTAQNISDEIMLSCLTAYLLSVLFFALAIFAATVVKERGMAGQLLYGAFTLFFVLGAVYDVMDDGALLRPFVPLRYFSYSDVSTGVLSGVYVAVTIGVTAMALVGGYFFFGKKDLTAV